MTPSPIRLRGVLAPVVSTFRSGSSEELDLAAFAANARAHLAAGLDGLVIAGSTGEAALLDAAERCALVETARAIVPRDKLLLVGTGAESTRTCLAQTRDAAARGADAALVVAPHYYGGAMTIDALRAHYRRIADESPVPVVLYSIPKYMHFSLPPALVAELATHDNVIGIKDSSGQPDQLASYLESQSDGFSVLTGNAQLFHHALKAGAPGGILAVTLFAPAVTLEVYNAFLAGDDTSATAAQTRVTPLGAKIVAELGIPGVKAAMDGVGLAGGSVRLPLRSLTPEQRRTVEDLLRSTELTAAA
jgi:dihydrodipicolinate synthase/N-acetylneuraminate lyase